MPEAGRPALDHVLRPGAIGTLPLPHRIVMGAMHLGTEHVDDGGRTLAAFYAARARGGAGLMVTGGAAVSAVGAGGPHYGLLGDAAFRDRLARVAGAVHEAGGTIALQLFHAGRYAFPDAFGLQPVAPSPVYSRFSGCEPAALTEAQIDETLEDFARGAAHGRSLGFDAVELMGSEGYLVDQFLSPVTNLRDDGWGGDGGRRRRFGTELVRRVRDAVGRTFPVIVRFTGADLMEGGTAPDEVAAFALALAAAGADALNVGVGWHEAPVPTVQLVVPPGSWVPVAAAVKDAVGSVPVIASNRVNRLEAADVVLATTAVDFVSMARPFLADPDLVGKARTGRRVNLCIACNQACIDRSLSDDVVSCMVNPWAGREWQHAAPDGREGWGGAPSGQHAAPDGQWGGAPSGRGQLVGRGPDGAPAEAGTPSRHVVVVGGGPAGLEAAKELALGGCTVDLYEAAEALGGQFRLACQVPGKEDYAETIVTLASELDRLGVAVHVGRPITADDLGLLQAADGVVVATGVQPRSVGLPGADLPHVVPYPEAFAAGAVGRRVVIIGGGGIAVDLAHTLSHRRHGPATAVGGGQATAGGDGDRRRRGLPSVEEARAFCLAWGVHGLGLDGDAAGTSGAGPTGPAADAAGPEVAGEQGGHDVTILHRSLRTAPLLGKSTRWAVLAELKRGGVRIEPGVTYVAVEPTGVRIVDAGGTERLVEADSVVVAVGQERDDAIVALVRLAGVRYQVIGGARDTTGLDAVRAFAEGLAAATALRTAQV